MDKKGWREKRTERWQSSYIFSVLSSVPRQRFHEEWQRLSQPRPGLENIVRGTRIQAHPSRRPSSASLPAGNMVFRSWHFQREWFREPQEFQCPEIKGREKLSVRLGGSDIATKTHSCMPHVKARLLKRALMSTREFRPVWTFNFAILQLCKTAALQFRLTRVRHHKPRAHGWI